jgi:predicted phosphohydrolase
MDWYAWLSAQESDLTVVAGDVLDGLSEVSTLAQMLAFSKWCNAFPGRLALCSGNHDANDEGLDYMLDMDAFAALSEEKKAMISNITKSKHWMDSLSRNGVVTDRRSELLKTPAGDLVITTIPFSFMPDPDPISASLWEAAATLRRKTGAPWVVLHHDPPIDTKVGGYSGDGSLLYRLRMWKPDYLFSGHLHQQPYNGGFADRLASTWCFNPGYPDQRAAVNTSTPNHIVLDLAERTATWNASSLDGAIRKTISFG